MIETMDFLRDLGLTTLFLLRDYVRSKRIFFEILVTLIFISLAIVRKYLDRSDSFFSVTSVLLAVTALVTMISFTSSAFHPRGYPLLMRPAGRTGYVLAHYLATIIIVFGMYLLISIAAGIFRPAADLTLLGWLEGSVPLLLNVALIAAATLLFSPLLVSSAWRLGALVALALALSGTAGRIRFAPDSEPLVDLFPRGVVDFLEAVRSVPGWVLTPVLRGFDLAATHHFGLEAVLTITAQLSLVCALVGLCVYIFRRRDIVLYE